MGCRVRHFKKYLKRLHVYTSFVTVQSINISLENIKDNIYNATLNSSSVYMYDDAYPRQITDIH